VRFIKQCLPKIISDFLYIWFFVLTFTLQQLDSYIVYYGRYTYYSWSRVNKTVILYTRVYDPGRVRGTVIRRRKHGPCRKKHYHAIHTIQYSKIIYKARMVNQMAESEATVDI